MAVARGKAIYPMAPYAFDAPCAQIVRILEARGWRVPGIDVEFNSGRIGKVTGDDFRLMLGPAFPGSKQVVGYELTIPGKQLWVDHQTESGPLMWVYVGGDWERDKRRFVDHSKVNSRLKRQPRWYLRYSGCCLGPCPGASGIRHTHQGRRSPILLADNDLGREYDPVGSEPTEYATQEVVAEFAAWLTQNVLPRLSQ